MDKIQEIFNFDDIGGKIKAWAKWFCWITILLAWIGAVICFFILLSNKERFYIAFFMPIVTILYSILIWVGSWATYAFGECVENISIICYNTEIIAQPIIDTKQKKTQHGAIRKPTPENPTEIGDYISGKTYAKGDIVSFEGKKYICEVNNTVWSPSAAPGQWPELTSEEIK